MQQFEIWADPFKIAHQYNYLCGQAFLFYLIIEYSLLIYDS